MDCSTPVFPVHHQFLELAQTHVHWVSDAIQLSHPSEKRWGTTYYLFISFCREKEDPINGPKPKYAVGSTLGHISRENSNLKRYMYLSVHSSTIYSRQDMEAAWISINRWIKKMWYIYTVNCYLAIRKNEMSSIATWMRDYHIKWGKSGKERQTPYNITWRRKWRPTLIFLPGEFHGQKGLVSYSPWGCKESDTLRN